MLFARCIVLGSPLTGTKEKFLLQTWCVSGEGNYANEVKM